jgi:cell division protein FtsQ
MTAWLARWRWAGLGVCAMLGLAAVGWTVRRPVLERLRQHPYFVITHVAIHGVGPALTPEDVTAWLGLAETSTLWEATPGAVRERLLAHPFIAAAAVKRIFPGRLEIVVRERRPQAIAVLGDLFYVDRGGVTFGPLRPEDPRNLPVITGLDADAPDGTRRWMLRRALRLLRRCEPDLEPLGTLAAAVTRSGDQRLRCVGPLSEVHVDADDGIVVFPAAPRVPLVLGWGSWHTKLARAERALRGWQGTTDQLARLDLRFRNQVVATMRQVAAPPPEQKLPGKRPGHRLKA